MRLKDVSAGFHNRQKMNASPSVSRRILCQLKISQMQMVQGDNHKACILAVVQWNKNSCTHAFACVATRSSISQISESQHL